MIKEFNNPGKRCVGISLGWICFVGVPDGRKIAMEVYSFFCGVGNMFVGVMSCHQVTYATY